MQENGYEMDFITEEMENEEAIVCNSCAPTDESYQYIDYNYRYNS